MSANPVAVLRFILVNTLRELKSILMLALVLLAIDALALLARPHGWSGYNPLLDIILFMLVAVLQASLVFDIAVDARRRGLRAALASKMYANIRREEALLLYPWLPYRRLLAVSLANTITGALVAFSLFPIVALAYGGVTQALGVLASIASSLAFLALASTLLGLTSARDWRAGLTLYTLLAAATMASILAYLMGLSTVLSLLPPGCFYLISHSEPLAVYSTLAYIGATAATVYILSAREPHLKPLDVCVERVERAKTRVASIDDLVDVLVGLRSRVASIITSVTPLLVYIASTASISTGLVDAKVAETLSTIGVATLTMVVCILSASSFESCAQTLGYTGWLYESSGMRLEGVVERLASRAVQSYATAALVAAPLYAAASLLDKRFLLYSMIVAATPLATTIALKPHLRIVARVAFKAAMRASRVPDTVPPEAPAAKTLWMEALEKKLAITLTLYMATWLMLFAIPLADTIYVIYAMATGTATSIPTLPPPEHLLYSTLTAAIGALLTITLTRLAEKLALHT